MKLRLLAPRTTIHFRLKAPIALTFSAIALGTVFLSAILAGTVRASSTTPNCQSPRNQLEINLCAGLEAYTADQRLNEVYKKVKAKIANDPQSTKELIEAEKAWIKFRDSECRFAANRYRGGTIAPAIYSGCAKKLTTERIQHLEEYLQNP